MIAFNGDVMLLVAAEWDRAHHRLFEDESHRRLRGAFIFHCLFSEDCMIRGDLANA